MRRPNPKWRLVSGAIAFNIALLAQTDWPTYGHDPAGTRYSPIRQINRSNVAQLQRAWTYHTGEKPELSGARGQRQTAFETTPLVVNGILYLTTPANRVIALDPVSGHAIWIFDPQAKTKKPVQYHAHRGVSYWPGNEHHAARILLGTLDGRLIALNARTGVPVPSFGNEGEVNLQKVSRMTFKMLRTPSLPRPPSIKI